MREWGWKRCRPLPASMRGIPEGSGFGSPRLVLPTPRPSPAPAPPGRAPAPGPAAAASSRPRQELGSPRGLQALGAAAGQKEPSGGWSRRARGGLASGTWVLDARIQLGTPWEPPSFTKGEVPAHQKRAEAAGAGSGAFGPCQRPAPPPHGAPTALHRGPVPAHLGPGSCPPPRRGTQPIAVATATSSGCIFCTRAAVGTWMSATSFRWALWAAFVAGVEPSWQPLPPRAPPAPRGSRPRVGGGGEGALLEPPARGHAPPLSPPRLWATLQHSQVPVASKAAPSEGRAHGHGHRVPAKAPGTLRAAPPPPPLPGSGSSRGAPRGASPQGWNRQAQQHGLRFPCPVPTLLSLPVAFPMRASVSPRENAPRAKVCRVAGAALRGCWPGSSMTSSVVLAATPALLKHPPALALVPRFLGRCSPRLRRPLQAKQPQNRDRGAPPGQILVPDPEPRPAPPRRVFPELCHAPSAGPRAWEGVGKGAFSRAGNPEEKGCRPERLARAS